MLNGALSERCRSDRSRTKHILLPLACSAASMIVLIAAPDTKTYLRYAALLVTVQSYCSLVVLWAWILTAFPSTLSHRGAHAP